MQLKSAPTLIQVKQIFDESQQRFGAAKIRIILAENGIRVGEKGNPRHYAGTWPGEHPRKRKEGL